MDANEHHAIKIGLGTDRFQATEELTQSSSYNTRIILGQIPCLPCVPGCILGIEYCPWFQGLLRTRFLQAACPRLNVGPSRPTPATRLNRIKWSDHASRGERR